MRPSPPFVIDERPLAVVVARDGRLPVGADEVAAEAGGRVLVVGPGARQAVDALEAAREIAWCDSGATVDFGVLARALARGLAGVPLILLPSSPDGRDLAPRLAASLGRPLLAAVQSCRCTMQGGLRIDADLLRLDERATVPASSSVPVVATLATGVRGQVPVTDRRDPLEWPTLMQGDDLARVQWLATIEPEPTTMDLAEATRVIAGGAGLVPRGVDASAGRGIFALLAEVAARLGASTGGTRVASDAGWIDYDRQIGTTGAWIEPQLYVALGISGASQHVGGLGAPAHVVSVNTDMSAPMTAMSDLGIVADAPAVLLALARRMGIDVAPDVARVLDTAGSKRDEAGHG